MTEKPTYEELEQRIRELESSAADHNNTTTIPIENDQIFKHCFDNANIGVCLVEPDGDFIKVNNRMVEIFGYSKQEFQGMNVDDVTYPEDLSISLEIQRKVKVGEIESTIFQKRYIHKKGHMFWGQVSNSIVKDHEGKHLYFVTHFMEITESKKNEEELQKIQNDLESLVEERTAELSKINMALLDSEERLHRVIDQSPFPVALVDTNDEKIIYWSQSAIEMFGHKPNTVVEWYELAYPNPVYREQVINRWKPLLKKALVSKNAVNTGEYDIVCKDGTVKTCELYAQFIPGNLVVTFHDITEGKKAELEIRQKEKRFRELSEMLPEAVFEADLEMNLSFVNQQAYTMFQYTKQDFDIGLNGYEMLVPEDRERAKRNTEKQFKDELLGMNEYRGIRKDGTVFPLLLHANPIIENDTKIGIRGIIVDITERKRMEARIQQSQKMEAIGNLAGGIAHDFNNILFPIVGMSELLMEDLPHNSQEYENAKEILKAGKRGGDLVRQILAFSRQSEHKLIPVRAQSILKEVLKLIRATIPSYIEVDENIQTDCGLLMADPTQIHQVAMNIITNAFHALESKGGKITVWLREITLGAHELTNSSLGGGRYAILTVTDTGEGISPNLMDKIFEPYFTTKEQGKGTGLGLAVAYGIIKEHKGDIKVHSKIGKGTTFDIYLPLMKKTGDIETYEQAKGDPKGNEHILLVDDEESIAQLERQMLERLGYNVTPRINSKEALEAFKAKPSAFDLVITDMTMPNITGDRLASELKGIRPDIPVIICTGFSERISKENAESVGVDAFLMKPIIKSDLAQIVRKVLDEAKS